MTAPKPKAEEAPPVELDEPGPADDDLDLEDELDETPEPEPEPEPEEPSSLKSAEDTEKQLETEDDRHAKAVADILGPDVADVTPCMLCFSRGFIPNLAAGHFPEDQREAVMRQMDGPLAKPMKTHPEFEACDVCNGHGRIISGSTATGQETQPCPTCMDKGWVRKAAEVVVPTVEQLLASAPPPPVFPTAPLGPDGWGRSPGHPDYGQHPDLVGRNHVAPVAVLP